MEDNTPSVKSGLAKLLAKENISVRHVLGLATANFDIQTRTLNLPVWKDVSEDLYDMLVIHEVGHALETPYKEWVGGIESFAKKEAKGDKSKQGAISRSFHGFQNILEDCRIDKLQRKRYPGSKRNYVIGYKELWDKGFFGNKDKPISEMTFIDRVNIYYKAGFSGIYVPFTEKEKEYLKKIEDLKTFDDVIKLAEDCWRRTKAGEFSTYDADLDLDGEKRRKKKEEEDEKPSAPQSPKGPLMGDDPDEDEEDQDQDEDLEKDALGDAAEEDEDFDDSEEEDEEETDTTGLGGGNNEYDPEAEPVKDEDFDPEDNEGWEEEEIIPDAETDKTFMDMLSDITAMDGTAYYYARFPKITAKSKLFVDYKVVVKEHDTFQKQSGNELDHRFVKQLLEWKKAENQTISFMVKEFELRQSAMSYSKTATAKTGVIDTNKLHSYQFSDDIFKRIQTVPKGKSHGFLMFIDWSGSMDAHMEGTMKQLFSLMLFCRRIQVPFEVFSFTNGQGGPSFMTDHQTLQMWGNIRIRNIFSSRMNTRDFNQSMINFWALAKSCGYSYNSSIKRYYPACEGMGGTPLNEAILAAATITENFRASAKVDITNVIFLTDGEGSSPGLPSNIYSNAKRYRIVVQDDKTKHEYMLPEVSNRGQNLSFDWTNTFLRMFKDRTKANLVGFYITDGLYGMETVMSQGQGSSFNYNEAKTYWKENGHYQIKNSGYDEYFLINKKTLMIDQEEFVVEAGKSRNAPTANKVAKNFAKFMKNKTLNRVLLSNFIKKIA